jgi:hypothetical protein
MNKLVLVIILSSFFSLMVVAQNSKTYVSMHGGKRKLATLGQFGYNNYRFLHLGPCDTLICFDPGYEKCKIPTSKYGLSKQGDYSASLMNKAIRKSRKYIRKNKIKSGEFYLTIQTKKFSVKYNNADKTGEADLFIETM